MANWDDLPAELRIKILRAFCVDIIARYETCLDTLSKVSTLGDDGDQYCFWAIVRDKPPSPVPAFPFSALLACKSFYYLITSITFNGLTLVETLQRYQMKMLEIYIDRDSDIEDGIMDFSVVDSLIQEFCKLFGCFWKNPECIGDEFTIGHLLGEYPYCRTWLICEIEK